jgi:Ca2+-binding EF-hand superfamily protein
MKMLGLNPMEQEIIDLTNNIVKNGFIYFPDFCKIIHEKYRQDDEELFRQNMFKVIYCQPQLKPSQISSLA